MTEETHPKMLNYCSRCGEEWCVLGRVLKWGKHYPAMTVKKEDGTTEEIPADDEIIEAVCKQCSKEIYDSEYINTALQAERERLVKIVCQDCKNKI